MNLADLRRVYARQMLAVAGRSGDTRLEDAFAAVPRERFLGDDEWRISTPWSLSTLIPDRDPALIYQDVVVALDKERGVNNGSPSLHVRWMHAVSPRKGERVAHIGAGTGYYSAILSELVGAEGRVTAVEYDRSLAIRAGSCLRNCGNVTVVQDNGCAWPQTPVDVVYVNFAVARPARPWIENLAVGGRLIFPLGVPRTAAYVEGRRTLNAIGVMVTRRDEGYAASALEPVSFVFAEEPTPGVSAEDIRSLQDSLDTGRGSEIKSLIWNEDVERAACWFKGSGWALSFHDATSR